MQDDANSALHIWLWTHKTHWRKTLQLAIPCQNCCHQSISDIKHQQQSSNLQRSNGCRSVFTWGSWCGWTSSAYMTCGLASRGSPSRSPKQCCPELVCLIRMLYCHFWQFQHFSHTILLLLCLLGRPARGKQVVSSMYRPIPSVLLD